MCRESLLQYVMYRKFLLFLTLVCVLIACRSESTGPELPAALDYADSRCWYEANRAPADKSVDLFYVVPTCIWDYTDAQGRLQHYMDVFDTAQRDLVDPSIALARRVLSDSCNFFSPYYRQISMDSWLSLDTTLIADRFQLAYHDVVAAFRYYLEHLNQGRPFILAGHSQGAKAVIELLKHEIDLQTAQRLVATYAIGFTLRPWELDRYPALNPARDSTDTGVLIGFNSVTRPEAVSPLFRDNVVCINPLNWRTDATPARSDQGFTAAIDPAIHTIVVQGIDEESHYIPSVEALLPKGNLHVWEFNLYEEELRRNVLQRIRAFRKRNADTIL